MPGLLAEKRIKTVYCFDALAEHTCKLSILGELSAQPDSFLMNLRSRSQETHCQRSVARCAVCLYLFRIGPAVSDEFGSNQRTYQAWRLHFVVQMAWGLVSSQALLAFFNFFTSNMHFDHISCAENVSR